MLTKMCHNHNSQRMLKEDNMGQLLWGKKGCSISLETQNSSNVKVLLWGCWVFFFKDLLAVAIGDRWREHIIISV